MFFARLLTTLAAAIAALALAMPAGAGAAAGEGASASAKGKRIPQTSCLWTERLAAKFSTKPEENYAYPDTGAAYWTSKITMPAGSQIVLRGKFAHSRYQSLNSYDAAAASPLDAVNDVSTRPDKGSRNPYRPGARRDTPMKKRKYRVRVVNQPVPASKPGNTLFAGVEGQQEQILFYRVYLPEPFKRNEQTGGAGLPWPKLKLADGTVLKRGAACQALSVEPGQLTPDDLSFEIYNSFREKPGEPDTFPAVEPPLFQTFYSKVWGLGCWYQGNCDGQPERIGGQYSNVDNEYAVAFTNRSFDSGPVLVLHGKLPSTPDTRKRVKRMPKGQLRYWSICQNESVYTTASSGCLYDRQIPVDKQGRYTIVTSKKADRPANARRKCGVGYLPWPENGDGAGHLDDGMLILRNMLPAKNFRNAIQNTQTPGDEAEVMGAYLPKGAYTTKASFQKSGC